MSNKKTQEIEMELEELAAKLAAKQVELLAVELQIREYKSKVPDLAVRDSLCFSFISYFYIYDYVLEY